MRGQKNRLIIDTNLWISFLLTKDFSKLDAIFTDNHVILLFSQELIDEFLEVTQRPKLKRYFSETDVEALLIAMNSIGEIVDVTSKTTICRDAKDNFLLSLAKDGNATHLLTGDNDLLDLKIFEGTKILSISTYLSL